VSAHAFARAAVIGAGTMGHGIAQMLALAGLQTMLADSDAAAVERGRARITSNLDDAVTRGKLTTAAAEDALARIASTTNIHEAIRDADLVVEAVVEDLDIKRELFADVDRHTREAAVLATNTSSLPVTQIAAATARPERVLGMHFFNPVHIMSLVELVRHPRLDAGVLDRVRALVAAMGKTAIVVHDSPGFASSRLGVALGLEAMRMLEEGVASAEDIDTAMTLGYGHPMGPLRVSDVVGLDVRLRIAEYLHRELGSARFEPPEILRRKVRDGELGKKTGKGFYDWP
jgi:3-hydroxybutyryl-CoA dehydrogenase